MLVRFPYGRGYLEANLPEDAQILYSREAPVISDIDGEVARSLENPIGSPPLKEFLKDSKNPLLIIPDKTRAFPSRTILPTVVRYVRENSRDSNLRILVATGFHEPVSEREIREMVGEEIAGSIPIVNHVAVEADQIEYLGEKTSHGTPIEVNKMVLESDFVMGLGLIEPHFFAGYSGGRKSMLPGVAGERAIFSNHSFRMVDHPNARTGVLEGNPIHEDMVEFAKKTGLNFILNVTLNKEKKVTGIFAGDPFAAHLDGVKHLDRFMRVKPEEKTEIVITTNGGFPLDRDLYQAVKGIDTSSMIVKDGGVIIIASECLDGLGGHIEFLKLAKGLKSPEEMIERIKAEEPVFDQWQVQILARALKKSQIILVSHNIDEGTARDFLMEKAGSLEEALEKAYEIVGRDAGITAIPEGPYIIPES